MVFVPRQIIRRLSPVNVDFIESLSAGVEEAERILTARRRRRDDAILIALREDLAGPNELARVAGITVQMVLRIRERDKGKTV